MDFFEPISRVRIAALSLGLLLCSSVFSNVQADYFSKDLLSASDKNDSESFIIKAKQLVEKKYGNKVKALVDGDNSFEFKPTQVVGDPWTTTVKFEQRFQNLEVVGGEKFVHFFPNGNIQSVSNALEQSNYLSNLASPVLTPQEATQVVSSTFGANVRLDKNPILKFFPTQTGNYRLAYELVTKTGVTHSGHRVYVDALDGSILLQSPRAYDARKGQGEAHSIVYRADTPEARRADRIEADSGAPTDINFAWYKKVYENGNDVGEVDSSAENAKENSKKTFDYYKETFKRNSYDNKGAKITSVVHIGENYNNAFWTDEFELMGYGDGDGKKLTDLTVGLDVAAHEITHAVTDFSAKLQYNAESGALNESYSDFFGKMVDSATSDWLIGAKIMAPALKRRALRNMINPEEFKQPGSNDSPLKVPTKDVCWAGNDYCGVHTNSGIPNRAAALIAEAIGRKKAANLYYQVLTQRLSPTSNFKDARAKTEEACKVMFDGSDSSECKAVTEAYDKVKM